jgi:cell wall-associated NlpC family hydrolase
MTNEQREAIVTEAKTWVGTPYVGWSQVKGPKGGTDCGMLIKSVYQHCGLIPQGDLGVDMSYSLQISQHLPDKTYLNTIESYMHEISEDEVQPGDVVVYKLGLAFAHAGIVIEWPTIIHAIAHGGVRMSSGISHPRLRRATHKFYALNEVL